MNPFIFVSIGILLMIAEVLVLDFTFFLIGSGFLITGFLSFLIPLSWEVQTLFAFVISIILLVILRKPLKEKFLKSKGMKDNFLDESGIGEIKNGMIYYKGTFWKSNEISNLNDGDKVEILGIKNGQIVLKTH